MSNRINGWVPTARNLRRLPRPVRRYLERVKSERAAEEAALQIMTAEWQALRRKLEELERQLSPQPSAPQPPLRRDRRARALRSMSS